MISNKVKEIISKITYSRYFTNRYHGDKSFIITLDDIKMCKEALIHCKKVVDNYINWN